MAEESKTAGEYAGLGGRAKLREFGVPASTAVLTLVNGNAAYATDLVVDRHYRLIADIDCFIKVGSGAQTSSVNEMYLPAKTVYILYAKTGYVNLAAQAGAGGKLFITLLDGT